ITPPYSLFLNMDIGLYLLRADLAASSALEKPEHDFLNPRGSIQLNGFGAYAYKFIPPLSEIG
ncbi:hypothetical protein M1752_25330, partial [Salmonella enterica subsp. enterica serovar Sandiego]